MEDLHCVTTLFPGKTRLDLEFIQDYYYHIRVRKVEDKIWHNFDDFSAMVNVQVSLKKKASFDKSISLGKMCNSPFFKVEEVAIYLHRTQLLEN